MFFCLYVWFVLISVAPKWIRDTQRELCDVCGTENNKELVGRERREKKMKQKTVISPI